ncbi:MAG: hypothetical protein NTU83_06380 [Candidatus Hydrogenedentes bacterium]|nr:hypothetical protein [Candidatus Hydrogenedentota bacterium]
MSSKRKVQLQYSDDLESVDTALSEAMNALDEKNERVTDLLRTFEPPKEPESLQSTPAPQNG